MGAGLLKQRPQKRPLFRVAFFDVWLREPDLNRRPSGYEPDELPDCSIPRLCGGILQRIAGVSSNRQKKMLFLQAVSVAGGTDIGGAPRFRGILAGWVARTFRRERGLLSVRKSRE